MDKLNEVETQHVEPLIYMTPETSVLREDVLKQEITTAQALQNAPAQDGKYFRVLKVIDKS
jgi:aspartyl-tRNA(Asn)/glutamyl-tRNA(Gln) amidotransferase subunit C